MDKTLLERLDRWYNLDHEELAILIEDVIAALSRLRNEKPAGGE